jgi:hypothetical protein
MLAFGPFNRRKKYPYIPSIPVAFTNEEIDFQI